MLVSTDFLLTTGILFAIIQKRVVRIDYEREEQKN